MRSGLTNRETGFLQSFTWNFGTAVQEVESLQLTVVARNVLRGEKVIGRYGLVLQSVVRDGRVSITDALVDLNNKPIPVRYQTFLSL